jgi:putative pyruvate formate lyase activating enzyme
MLRFDFFLLPEILFQFYIAMSYFDSIQQEKLRRYAEEFRNCQICPRECKVDRFTKRGYCNSGSEISLSSVCVHKGEEPVVSGNGGICNIFFSRCNLQCIYCQNSQISSVTDDIVDYQFRLDEVIDMIIPLLEKGAGAVGFVSPSHFVPIVKMIVTALRYRGYNPVFVYNTNAYEKVETIRSLDEFIDVFLPDYKYADSVLSKAYSGARDYPEVALAAITEMKRLKGTNLPMNENGYATSGVIVRHLILPSHVENSLEVLRRLAIEISPMLHISLMSQYYPAHHAIGHPALGRVIEAKEYEAVQAEMERLGLSRGWWQEFESSDYYRPDFLKTHPFE